LKLLDILDSTPFPIGYRIAFITNFFREPVLREMELRFDIIRPELTVLMCAHVRDYVHAKDICEITEQPPNTVGRGVASLERKGLIRRSRDKKDTRRQTIKITPAGEKLHGQIMKMFKQVEKKMLAGLTKKEQAQLFSLLDKIARDVEHWHIVRLTRKLTDALALIDVCVLDHLIIGQGVQTSLAERGSM